MKLDDLTGRRFGILTVKEYLGNGKWKCMCDCGKETTAFGTNLKRGHTTSCGCRRANNPLAGKRFGYLCVIERIPKRDRYVWYRCVCDCGNECEVKSQSLVCGHTKSCGKCELMKAERTEALLSSGTFVDGTQPSKLHSKPTKANKSGIVGVNWDKSRNQWQAGIRFKGHKYNLGRFTKIEEAAEARRMAEKAIFGNFLAWYEEYKKSADD